MNSDARLNLRARQILDDPTLAQNQRVSNPDALLKQLAASVEDDDAKRDAMLDEISDPSVREAMRSAIATVNG